MRMMCYIHSGIKCISTEMAYIYLITNIVNSKTYVGKTNSKSKYYYTGGLLIRRQQLDIFGSILIN